MNSKHVTDPALAVVNDYVAAETAGCPVGWKHYRLPGARFFAPASVRAWWLWSLHVLGNLGLVALFVLAAWAYLAAGATR